MVHKNSIANLISAEELNARLTPEQRRENASRAGIASAEARAQRSKLREDLEILLDAPTKDGTTVQQAVAIAAIDKALKGNIRAAEFIRDTVDGKPTTGITVATPAPVVLMGYDDIED